MKYAIAFTSILALAFAGCASKQTQTTAPSESSPETPSANTQAAPAFEQVVHLAYQCKDNGKKAPILVASYGIINNEPVAAQLNIANSTSPALMRVESPNADTENVFTANGFTWITQRATLQNIGKAQGVMLTRHSVTTVNGKEEAVDNILLKDCVIDAKATQSLVQQPAEAAK